MIDAPRGHYRCILMDPPWKFATYDGTKTVPCRTVNDHYPTMSLDEMKALPVSDLAAQDCALFMWIVGSHLEESLELARHWGFRFKTDALYWAKSQRRMLGDYASEFQAEDPVNVMMGMGYWTRKQVEPCWLFTRGKPARLSKGVRQLIIEPRREHSRKPDAQYERIEALVAGPRLEMFSRTHRPGWDAWGNDTARFRAA